MQLNNKYIDYDFRTAPQRYYRGSIMPRNAVELCAELPAYEDVVPPIPSNRWKEIVEHIEATKSGIEWLISRIFNQAQEGSCVGNAITQMMEMLQAKQFGKGLVTLLSAISMYQLIGRSPSSGAVVSHGLDKLREVGIVPLDTPENRQRFGGAVMPHTGFYTKRPAGAAEVAANFKADEFYVIRTYEGLVTAGLVGDGAVVGRAGHSIKYLRPTFQGAKLLYTYVNSWRESWGFAMAGFKGGFGADSEKLIRQSARWAFAVRSTVTPSWI
jgi:hypothetical protein